MSKLTTILLSAAFAVGTAASASATTVATFSITDGLWNIENGETITITGEFEGTATGLVDADPGTPLPLVFGAGVEVNGQTVFNGEIGPVPASPFDLFAAAMGIATDINNLTGNAFGDVVDYMTAGLNREITDADPFFDLGPVDLFFSYTGGATGPTTLDGSFTAVITQDTGLGPGALTQLINNGLIELDLLGLDVVPSNGGGPFDASLSITAVPLPAGLPLLGAGLFGLFMVGRRRRKAA